MSENTHKLTAILSVDIVGYTALMQKDEPKANQLLEKFHFTLQTEVSEYRGQVINNYGDSCVCTFGSAVYAVRCAEAIQTIFQDGVKVPVRIGLHSGDVLFKEGNIYGDSVNIASGIESLGVAGAVLFSDRIRRHISNQADLEVQSLGMFEFKNVTEPMEVFGLVKEGLVVPKKGNNRCKLS